MLQKITATVVLDYQNYTSPSQKQQDGNGDTCAPPTLQELELQAKEFARDHGAILNLQQVISQTAPRMALAAEFKRASPSKGDIAAGTIKAGEQAVQYSAAGADIISCLTENRWFKGSLVDLTEIRLETSLAAAEVTHAQRPAVLRKDFVVSKYMIAEAAAAGADTVLLIVAVLPQSLLKELIDYCRESFQMEPLVEVHADEELQVAIDAGAKVIGVNNRNLHTFQLDLATSERVAVRLTERGLPFRHQDIASSTTSTYYTLCALSGMSTCYDVDRYRKAGLSMCLIGESLMRAADPAAAIASLCLDPADFVSLSNKAVGGAYTLGTQIVKVCGITNAEDALVACQAGANLVGVIFAIGSKRCVSSEQAREVVRAVQQFGERSQRLDFSGLPGGDLPLSPMQHLVSTATVLAQLIKQRPAVVGVFQNQEEQFIRQMVDICGLDMVQLHGKEGMAAANRKNFGVPAIRVVDVSTDPLTGKASDNASEYILEGITNDPALILLDTSLKGSKEGGGTGVSFDWSIVSKVQSAGLPVMIAGGLTADTVKDCVSRICPFGVDVSSGVETTPGKKDHSKVKSFVVAANDAAVQSMKAF